MDWEEFSARFGLELKRLGVSDRDARFLGFDEPDPRVFELLSLLPDNVGVEAFYRHLGADFNELLRQESGPPPIDA
jgi:hypothetical protein